MVVLSITSASLAEAEKGGGVAATLKCFFGMFMQPALNQKDGAKKGAEIGKGGVKGRLNSKS
jgi:hypothetical protein